MYTIIARNDNILAIQFPIVYLGFLALEQNLNTMGPYRVAQ